MERQEDMELQDDMKRLEASLKKAISSALKSRGMTQQELCNVAGVQQGSLSRFLRGVTGISGNSFMKLVVYLGGELTFPGVVAARPGDDARTRRELDVTRAQLAAEKEKTAMLERLLATALSAGRGAGHGAADAPAAGEPAQRKAG